MTNADAVNTDTSNGEPSPDSFPNSNHITEAAPQSTPSAEMDAEPGRETVRLSGMETVRSVRTDQGTTAGSGGAVSRPHGRPEPIVPGCVCPQCERPVSIHGGIGSDYIFQAVLAELGTRGVEVTCEGCGNRFVFGAATKSRSRSRAAKVAENPSESSVEPNGPVVD